MSSLISYIRENRRFLIITSLSICFYVVSALLVHADPTVDQAAAQAAKDAGSGGIIDSIGDTIIHVIYAIALAIGGYLFTGIGGTLLDMTINQTILQAGLWFSPNTGWGLGEAIQQMWMVIRDMLNILFIFSFIYIGIKTILDSHSSETRRSLGLLIMAALLINFSLFFTEVIIDFSNIAAIQIHNLIKTGLAGGASAGSLSFDSDSIAGGFINVTSLSSFFGGGQDILSAMSWPNQIAYTFLMMIFLIIAGIVFAMGAFLLIRRFITLTLCMIFSPLMFAGWILPQFSETQEQWRGKLLMNAFFAPAFLFMIYLSLHILDALKGHLLAGTSADGFAGAATGGAGAIGIMSLVFFFALAIGFLYASIQIGQRMSISGSDAALKITKKAIGGATAGLAARGLRNTVGYGADRLAESNWMKDQASKSGVAGYISRGALQGSRVVADSNLDLRAQGIGAGFGQARKGGYKTTTKEIADKEEKFSKSLGVIDDEDETVKRLKGHEHHLHDELDILQEEKKDALKKYKEEVERIDRDATLDDEQKKDAKVVAKEATVGKANHAIDEKKKEIKAAGEAVEHEKNRRVVGSYEAGKAYKKAQDDLKAAESERNEVADQLQEAIRTNDFAAQRTISAQLKNQNARVKELARGVRAAAKNAGYAGVLENNRWFDSATFARLSIQDNNAGRAIRKKYSKGSMKEDAHGHGGGGHDDHGGGDHGGGGGAHGGGAHH